MVMEITIMTNIANFSWYIKGRVTKSNLYLCQVLPLHFNCDKENKLQSVFVIELKFLKSKSDFAFSVLKGNE